MIAARKLRSKSGAYTRIIEINVPVRFYWVGEEYDGLEFGPLPEGTTRYQLRLIGEVLEELFLKHKGESKEEIIQEHLQDREQAVKQAEDIVR